MKLPASHCLFALDSEFFCSRILRAIYLLILEKAFYVGTVMQYHFHIEEISPVEYPLACPPESMQ